MRVSYFLHPLIEGINKDGPDIEKNFLGEDEKGQRAGWEGWELMTRTESVRARA